MSKLSEILIYYLCIGSIEDNAICVDFVAEDKKKEKKEFKNKAKETLNQVNLVRLNFGERLNQTFRNNKVVALTDKSLKYLFLSILDTRYPEYKIFSLLEELNYKLQTFIENKIVKEKKDDIQMIMVELHRHYNDPSVISLYYAQKEINSVKKEMRENIKTIYNKIDNAEILIEKSERVNEGANILNKNAVQMNRKTKRCSSLKCKIFILVISISLIIGLFLLIYLIVFNQ